MGKPANIFAAQQLALTLTTETDNCLHDTDNFSEGPSEDYGNDEHTTVAAFLPWRGL